VTDVRYRPLRPDDSWAAYAIFRRSVADLLTRQGQSWPWVEQDEAEWLQWRPLFEHMEASADQAWGAEVDGQLVGYARSIRRDDTRELTELFVLVEAQGRGVGRALLERAFPAAGVRHRSIVATADPAALSRYLRQGFRSTSPVYAFEGRPIAGPAGLGGLTATPLAELPAEERLAALATVDGVVLGARRDPDHVWLGERGHGWLLTRLGAPVGYAYSGTRQGPIATLDREDMPAAIGLVEHDALGASPEPVSLTVPLANSAATDYLLARGYRLDPFTLHLLEDRPVIAADRYILTSPPFFL
jgi:GNAT superfamily N-acetyltransferase